MTLVLDIKEAAELDHGTEGTRLVRPAYAHNIPAAAISDPFFLINVLLASGLPPIFDAHPASASLRVRRHVIRPGANTNDAHILIIYEGPSQQDGTIGATWVIEDRSTLAQEVEEMDLQGKPIQAVFTYETSGPPISATNPTPAPQVSTSRYTAGVPVLRPRRTIACSGIVRGRPQDAWLVAQGAVNDREFAGLPVGYWLCTEVGSRLSGRGRWSLGEDRIYNVECSFMSKVLRDWSSYAIYRTKAGHVPDTLTTDDENSRRKLLMDAQYVSGQSVGATNGFVRVGMYPVTDFQALFDLPL